MDLRAMLSTRMQRPQRHRLLQGFPALPAMQHAGSSGARPGVRGDGRLRHVDGALLGRDGPDEGAAPHEAPWLALDRTRPLIIGVIPHTQCVPTREACGFCTFPHDRSNATARHASVESVLDQIDAIGSHEALDGRAVDAIYLGGGTANLSPPRELAAIVRRLGARFRIEESELSLEGAPHLFDRLLDSHLDTLAAMPVRRRRISMGVQTFEASYLRQMGREHFGDAALVRRLVRRCGKLDIGTSCDLLFNLPCQTFAQMRDDVDTAIDLGLEQICLYNLVLFEGLGTPWSRDPDYLAEVHANEAAAAHWIALREHLVSRGWVQSTLTNFERADVAASAKRFRYEVASYAVERTDGLGFGPLSLTTVVSPRERRALKLFRRKRAAGSLWSGDDLMYRYDETSLRALFLTRGLAKTRVEASAYEVLFGASLFAEIGAPLEVLGAAGLVAVDEASVALTPRGMFFADAVVSLLNASLLDAQKSGAGVHTRDLLGERLSYDLEYAGMG